MRRALLLCMIACDNVPSGSLDLNTCGETDVFSQAPAPTTLLVEALDSSGNTRTLVQTALPAASVDLGNQTQTDVVSLRVSGMDANANRLVYGASLFVTLGSLQDQTFPIFVQRTGQWARMCGALPDAREAPIALILNRRSIIVAGGTDPATDLNLTGYDLATLSALTTSSTLPFPPLSLAFGNNEAAVIGDGNAATSFSFTDGTTTPLDTPTGMTFADVAGGATVVGDDGSSYVVGATRPMGPTQVVYVVSPQNVGTMARLAVPAAGAAATFVPGKGVVVFGGGGGVQVLAAGSTSASPLPFAPDPTTGSGAALLAGSIMLVAGGVDATGNAPPRIIDLNCTTNCVATPWAMPLPVPLNPAQVFGFDANSAIVVGDDNTGFTRVFKLTATTTKEVGLKIPRKRGRAVIAPTGAVVVVGGATVPESFFP